jgi:transposase-like protein
MSAGRRSRASWEQLVAEVERSGSVARTAERHGVNPQRLSWWRWSLRREKGAGSARLLPVVVAGLSTQPHAPSVAWLEIAVGGVAIRVPIGSDAGYVAALVAAIRTTC